MRIGLVGAKIWIKETIKRISQDFPDIQFIAFPYNNVLDLPAVLEGKQYMCDYFLFAGDTARRWAETKIKPIVPWFSIPRSTSAFLRILAMASLSGYSPRFITDYANEEYFHHALDEAGIDISSSQISYISYIPYGIFTGDEYMEKNAELMMEEYKKTGASYCATIFIGTYEILKKQHIPVYYMMPSFEDVRYAVQNVVTSSETTKANDDLITIITIRINLPDPVSLSVRSFPQYEKEFITANKLINEFCFKQKGACFRTGDDTFVIISTNQALKVLTNKFTQLELLSRINECTNLPISVGFGASDIILEAKIRSQKALQFAEKNGGNCAFFLGDHESLIGPIHSGNTAPLKESDNHLYDLAQMLNINYLHLKSISQLSLKEHRITFTAAELADACGIRNRTMNRIILKLIDCGCCKEIGTTSPMQRGRPRRIIELHLGEKPTIPPKK